MDWSRIVVLWFDVIIQIEVKFTSKRGRSSVNLGTRLLDCLLWDLGLDFGWDRLGDMGRTGTGS